MKRLRFQWPIWHDDGGWGLQWPVWRLPTLSEVQREAVRSLMAAEDGMSYLITATPGTAANMRYFADPWLYQPALDKPDKVSPASSSP